MRNCNKIWVFLMVLVMSFSVVAEITFHGDARVRPRLEQTYSMNDEGDFEKSSQDIYYLYWIRMWMNAELTDGWFATAKISADGPADFIGKFGIDETYDGLSGWDRNNSNGAIRWTEAYFGRRTEEFGFCMGLLPFNGLTNPELDFHFYHSSTTDIPYFILAKNSNHGFRGYYNTEKGKITVALSVDNNYGADDMVDSTENGRDQYSFYAKYATKAGDITIEPTLIKTFAGKDKVTEMDMASPLTIGANIRAPKVSGFGLTGGLFYTMQGVKDAGEYSGFMVRGQATKKAGPGLILARIDFQNMDYDMYNDKQNNYYLWLMYKYTVYKSDIGSFALMPTFRRISLKRGDDYEWAKNRIEVTMHITFK